MEKMRMESEDIQQDNIAKIVALFPNCVTEARDEDGHLKKAINFELLKQMLSDSVIDGDEAYEFTWVGKKASIVEANRPIRKTLRPVKEDSVNWDTTENLYIEGDNLEVLKLLQESYLGKVKMIYIDPPYNTGNDFIYNDDFKVSSEEYADESGEVDEEGNRMFKNTDSNGRFHSDWCSMIYSRLMLARNLLSEDGVIFISIDEKESANLRKIGDEVFGESNFVSNIIWQSRTSISNDYEVSLNHNHTLIYSKNRMSLVFGGDPIDSSDYVNPDNDPRGPWKLVPLDANHAGGNTVYPVTNPKTGDDYLPPNGRIWCYNRTTMEQLIADGRIKFGLNDDSAPKRKLYLNERLEKGDNKTPSSILLDAGTTKDGTTEIMNLFDGQKLFDYPKSVDFIKRLITYGAPSGGIVMDFFAGSGTTAQAAMEYASENAVSVKYIMIQLQEDLDRSLSLSSSSAKKTLGNAVSFLDSLSMPHLLTELSKERIRRAAKKIHEDNPDANFDDGFRVLRLDDTNMNDVYYAAGDYDQGMLHMLESNIKSDRTDLDLLFGCLLEWGLPLSLPYTSERIDGHTVHNYKDGDLIACFDENVPESVIKTIAKRQPLRAVFRDSSFASSPEKINVGEIFKSLAPDTRVKVI
ncbi:site-specific DNA-methyltransferase [Stomatobaculum longum]|mgnify:FL=1|uniref:site-specific DNA-methyltransferase n=1 Tax=Stomatobaculum longum TaxID=796942 RepID=UPI002803AF39|nr:site-specific DNA-methyltransferase [Stomatobaculum longum]